MVTLYTTIRLKDDVVASISVLDNYSSCNKIFVGDDDRRILVKVRFMNSEDRQFIIVSDNITSGFIFDMKQSIDDCNQGSDLFQEMTSFQFCEYLRDMLTRMFKVESDFNRLRNADEVKDYFGVKHERASYKINWRSSDQPLSIVKESWQNTNSKKHSFIHSILKRKDLKWLNFSTSNESLCRSMTVADDEILLIRYDRRSSTNGSSTSVSFSRYHDIDEVQSIVAKEILAHVGPFTAEEKKYISKEWL